MRPVYTAIIAEAARTALDQVTDIWGTRYPAIIRLWEGT